MSEVTQPLGAMHEGDGDDAKKAANKLFELVYAELHKMASGLMAGEHRKNHTLQPTALVHEAFMRLVDGTDLKAPSNRRFFFFTAARAMRQLLIEHERRRKSAKRGGMQEHVQGNDILDGFEGHRRMQFRTGQYRIQDEDEDEKEEDILDGNAGPPDRGENSIVGTEEEHPWDRVLDQVRGQYGMGFGELAGVIDEFAVEDEEAATIVWLRFMGGMKMQEIGECLGITKTQADSEWRLAKKWLKGRLEGLDE